MSHFHGDKKHHTFFEGWYCKHENAGHTLALIPAFHIDSRGQRSASIQVITEYGSDYQTFCADMFCADKNRFHVRIGDNLFCESGIRLNLKTDRFCVRGTVRYSPLTPPPSDMMGPFHYLPGLQCNHGVLSLSHALTGKLTINGQPLSFQGGTGYIEKDWGNAFPSTYLWTQCGWRERGGECCVMLCVADIPLAGLHFDGCLCQILYRGRQYRLATYRGVKLLKAGKRQVILEQGPYRLQVTLLEENGQFLKAPDAGSMIRTIRESAACSVWYRFEIGGEVLFDHIGKNAGYEFVG